VIGDHGVLRTVGVGGNGARRSAKVVRGLGVRGTRVPSMVMIGAFRIVRVGSIKKPLVATAEYVFSGFAP
jgi:hypothetical protein